MPSGARCATRRVLLYAITGTWNSPCWSIQASVGENRCPLDDFALAFGTFRERGTHHHDDDDDDAARTQGACISIGKLHVELLHRLEPFGFSLDAALTRTLTCPVAWIGATHALICRWRDVTVQVPVTHDDVSEGYSKRNGIENSEGQALVALTLRTCSHAPTLLKGSPYGSEASGCLGSIPAREEVNLRSGGFGAGLDLAWDVCFRRAAKRPTRSGW